MMLHRFYNKQLDIKCQGTPAERAYLNKLVKKMEEEEAMKKRIKEQRENEITEFIKDRFPSVRKSLYKPEKVLARNEDHYVVAPPTQRSEEEYCRSECEKHRHRLKSGLLTPPGEPCSLFGGPIPEEFDIYASVLNDEDQTALKEFIKEKYGKYEEKTKPEDIVTKGTTRRPQVGTQPGQSDKQPRLLSKREQFGKPLLHRHVKATEDTKPKPVVVVQKAFTGYNKAKYELLQELCRVKREQFQRYPMKPSTGPTIPSLATKGATSEYKKPLRGDLKATEDTKPKPMGVMQKAFTGYSKAKYERLQELCKLDREQSAKCSRPPSSVPKIPSLATKVATSEHKTIPRWQKCAGKLMLPKPPPPRDGGKTPLVAQHRRITHQDILRDKIQMKDTERKTVAAARLDRLMKDANRK